MSKKCSRCHTTPGKWRPKLKIYSTFDISESDNRCDRCFLNNQELNIDHVDRWADQYPISYNVVYGIVNSKGKIMYVGETYNGPKRIAEHLHQNCKNAPCRWEDRTGWSWVELDQIDDDDERWSVEQEIIQALRPKYNNEWQ